MLLVNDPEKARHWRYFLLLEEDLDRALRVVEPDPTNLGVFGLDLARQLVGVCAQFEVVARLLCGERVPNAPVRKIGEICSTLLQIEPKLLQAEAWILWRTDRLRPFDSWQPSQPPPWWSAYNKVKHDPAKQLANATLRNVLNACAALGLVTQEYVGESAIHANRVFWLEWPFTPVTI